MCYFFYYILLFLIRNSVLIPVRMQKYKLYNLYIYQFIYLLLNLLLVKHNSKVN